MPTACLSRAIRSEFANVSGGVAARPSTVTTPNDPAPPTCTARSDSSEALFCLAWRQAILTCRATLPPPPLSTYPGRPLDLAVLAPPHRSLPIVLLGDALAGEVPTLFRILYVSTCSPQNPFQGRRVQGMRRGVLPRIPSSRPRMKTRLCATTRTAQAKCTVKTRILYIRLRNRDNPPLPLSHHTSGSLETPRTVRGTTMKHISPLTCRDKERVRSGQQASVWMRNGLVRRLVQSEERFGTARRRSRRQGRGSRMSLATCGARLYGS